MTGDGRDAGIGRGGTEVSGGGVSRMSMLGRLSRWGSSAVNKLSSYAAAG